MFVHDLKKLLEQAMPGLEENARNQLLLHQFLSGLPEAASKQLRVGGEVKALDIAISRARLIMTVDEPGQNAQSKMYASAFSNQSTGSEWWPMNETNEELDYYYCMPPYCTLDSFNGSTRVEFPAGAAVEVSVILL